MYWIFKGLMDSSWLLLSQVYFEIWVSILQLYMKIILSLVIILNSANWIYQNSVWGLIADFPAHFTNAVVQGFSLRLEICIIA